MKHLHAVIRGRVQMVGFRYFVLERARALGLTGWVRNGDDDDSVEVVAQGDESALRTLELSLREGPRAARVEDIKVRWSDEPEGDGEFVVR